MSSNKAKKRKVSLAPVLQDFTVTSFSDFHSDVAGPSDSSLFDEIQSYDAELPEITFNKTSDISLYNRPFPSDSSLDSLPEPPSNKKTTRVHRLFHKQPKKKSGEENLFDSCLKDSFSDNSLEPVQRPFQRKTINKARPSMFDSDLESSKCTKESPFKKPFQRKSKVKKQSDLFDSLIKDSQPDTPDQQSCSRPFQRKSKKGLNSDLFDDVLVNESTNPTPVHNLITRTRSRTKKQSDSNLFDEDLCSSQSDISTTVHPLSLKHRNASKSLTNDAEMFDDVLESSCDDKTTNDRCSDLSFNNKNNHLNEEQLSSDNLIYDKEKDNSKYNDSTMSEKSKDSDPKDESEVLNNENNYKVNQSLTEPTSVIDTNIQNNCMSIEKSLNLEYNLEPNNTIKGDDPSVHSRETETPAGKGILENNYAELAFQPLDQNKFLEFELEKSSKKKMDASAELVTSNLPEVETMNVKITGESITHLHKQLEFIEEKTIEREIDELTTYSSQDKGTESHETEDEDTIPLQTEDEDTTPLQTEDENTIPLQTEDEDTLRLEMEDECTTPLQTEDENTSKLEMEDEDTTLLETEDENTTDLRENESQNIAELRSNSMVLQEKRLSMPHRLSSVGITPNLDPGSICLGGKEMLVCSPDESFKGMPSSTPNLKGKRVSFMLKEVTYMKDSRIGNEVSNTSTFTRRKSSIRSTNKNFSSYLVKDNSMLIRKRRVSFKEDFKVNNSLNQSGFKNKSKIEQSKENKSNNDNSSISLESLVYLEPSGSGIEESESAYIDIHPSRGKSTSSSNPESFRSYRKDANVEEFKHQSGSKTFDMPKHLTAEVNSPNSLVEEPEIDYTKEHEIGSLYEKSCEIEVNKSNAIEEELKDESNDNPSCFTSESDVEEQIEVEEETREESAAQLLSEQESEKEPDLGDQESEEGLDLREYQESEEEQDLGEDEESEEDLGDDQESEEELDLGEDQESEEPESDKESGGQQYLVSRDQERHRNEINGDDSIIDGTFPEQDENSVKESVGIFKRPSKKNKVASKFEEKPLKVPSKSQLKDILNKIPISEFKKRNRRKSSEHYISREQMQQYEIEERLIQNQNKKGESGRKMFASSKLKRPKNWVTPGLYDFLINKLKPLFGITSHMKAEELVFYLADHVEAIMRKKELLREDVEEMKNDLATLGIVKTHWDFFKFVNRFFDYSFKEKMYPSSANGQSAFKFGPTNVMENIL